MTAPSEATLQRWGVIERLRKALRDATGPRFDRQWDNVVTDLADEVMHLIGEARGPSAPAAAPPEPLTGTDEDINVRVRVKSDWAGGPFMGGKVGVLLQYEVDQHALVRLDDGWHYHIPNSAIERAPAECPYCGASQVSR